MRGHSLSWLLRCPACGLWRSKLDEEASPKGGNPLDEAERETALEGLRRSNFERILDLLERRFDRRSGRLLEVGCGHGWFLAAAAKRGYEISGIEPDSQIAEVARRTGLPVLEGLFPDCLPIGEKWDILVFNDVFEHLPDPATAARICRDVLSPGGLLVLNLPTSGGVVFRLANLLASLGRVATLERLWQRGFPSPHLYYFDRKNLAALCANAGFVPSVARALPSIELNGLWSRVRMDKRVSLASAVVQCTALIVLYPIFRWIAPSDILLAVYSRRD